MTKLVSKNGTYSDNWLVCHGDCFSGKKTKTKWRSTDWCVTEDGLSSDAEKVVHRSFILAKKGQM